MSNFTSKVKGTVDKATSAARDMAQETTNMGDKSMDTQQYEDDSCRVTPEAMPIHKQYNEEHEEQIDKQNKDQYDPVSQLDMSPLSQESQNLAGSMEKEAMCSTAKEQMEDSNAHEDMSKSDLPPSQYMPESGNTTKQS